MTKKRFHAENLTRLTAEFEKFKKRLEDIYEDKLEGRIDNDFYDKKAQGYRQEQTRLLADIQKYQRGDQGYTKKGIELLDLAQSAYKDFEAQNSTEKRRLLAMFMEKGSWKGGVLESHFKQPFDILAVSNCEDPTKKPLEVGSEGFNEKWLPGVESNRSELILLMLGVLGVLALR